MIWNDLEWSCYPATCFWSHSSHVLLTVCGQIKARVVQTFANGVLPSVSLRLWPAADHEPYCRHVCITKLWRRIATTSQSWRSQNEMNRFRCQRKAGVQLLIASVLHRYQVVVEHWSNHRFWQGCLLLTQSLWVNLFTHSYEIWRQETADISPSYGTKHMLISWTVSAWMTSVTDGRTEWPLAITTSNDARYWPVKVNMEKRGSKGRILRQRLLEYVSA